MTGHHHVETIGTQIDGRDDLWRIVSEDERAPRADVVQIAMSIGIPDVRALCALDEARCAANPTKRAYRGINTTRN